jgi:hypothetical protein
MERDTFLMPLAGIFRCSLWSLAPKQIFGGINQRIGYDLLPGAFDEWDQEPLPIGTGIHEAKIAASAVELNDIAHPFLLVEGRRKLLLPGIFNETS